MRPSACTSAAAQHILGGRSVSIDKANFGFLHALLGEQERLLIRLAYNIITTSPETRRQLSEWMGNLRRHSLDQKIYPIGRTAVSILLRLAQFLLIAPNATPNAIRNCWLTLGPNWPRSRMLRCASASNI